MNQTFVVVAALGMILTALLVISFTGGDTAAYLPAPLSSAHARFTHACEGCHDPWNGAATEGCMACHQRRLANDLHGADRLEKGRKTPVYATMPTLACADCHREHRPTTAGGFTGPADFCSGCHPMVAMVDAHPDLPMELTSTGCRVSGCHQYHQGVPAPLLAEAESIRIRAASDLVEPPTPEPEEPLAETKLAAMKESPFYRDHPIVTARYEIGAHYGGEATCDACHLIDGRRTSHPPVSVCADCHKEETATFTQGRHGAAARFDLTGKKGPERPVGCGDCHDAHSLKTGKARREACLVCHQEPHAVAYEKSSHWRRLSEPNFVLSPLKAPDCAGCHMPRREALHGGVDHDETLSTSPPERAVADVCIACHGLPFAWSALLDEKVVESNFTYPPAGTPSTLTYTLTRGKERP